MNRVIVRCSSISTNTLRAPRASIVAKWMQIRGLHSSPDQNTQGTIPLRQHYKDEQKRRKKEKRALQDTGRNVVDAREEKWELTVGIEIHAELNSACKLFSSAPATVGGSEAVANSRVALFDASIPGTQPQFQQPTLLPAIRAAVALGCNIQRKSSWDRKHYFHWDQPNGYQITQYYEPFAKDGTLVLTAEDGVPAADLQGAKSITIGIKQIQMEQDTAKTTAHGVSTYHIDLNRAGHPLIEIITLPHIHSPQTAAAVVRSIQAVLKSVDACATGMELGGLRADVNVSVRQRGTTSVSSYGGVSGLGQRTEIKNLSSFKAVEEAIIAERKRQIDILEAGGVIEGETRGWSLGATETTRLRGKEGEVDYRYMPDADLPPLLISSDLVKHLKTTLPELPCETVKRVQQMYGLSLKDAKTLVDLDDGDRLEYTEETVDTLSGMFPIGTDHKLKFGKTVSNWVLHELGGLLPPGATWNNMPITAQELADLLYNLLDSQITSRSAKKILTELYEQPDCPVRMTVEDIINRWGFRLKPLLEEEYISLAKMVMAEKPDIVEALKTEYHKGKAMWFVGQMVRRADEGTVEPKKAEEIVRRLLSPP